MMCAQVSGLGNSNIILYAKEGEILMIVPNKIQRRLGSQDNESLCRISRAQKGTPLKIHFRKIQMRK